MKADLPKKGIHSQGVASGGKRDVLSQPAALTQPGLLSGTSEKRSNAAVTFVESELEQIDIHEEKRPAPDWIIDNIAEASKNAQQIFFILIALLAYCAITITGTTDREIILNSTVQLPILNANVSFSGFFLLAPALAILTFIYLQLYLQRLRGLTEQLRDNYQITEPRRLYPWLLSIADDPEPGSVGLLQRLVAHSSLWCLLPIVLLMFALCFVKKHTPVLSYAVGLYPILGLLVVMYFWRMYNRGRHLARQDAWMAVLILTITLCEASLLFYIIPRANDGRLYASDVSEIDASPRGGWAWFLRSSTSVDLSYQVLVTEQKKEYNTFWVDLEDAHLEGANLTHSILKSANMKSAHLQSTNLLNATLRGAQLDGADFLGSNLKGVDLSYASLLGVKNLHPQELCKAKTVYKAKLDNDLGARLGEQCPAILAEASQE